MLSLLHHNFKSVEKLILSRISFSNPTTPFTLQNVQQGVTKRIETQQKRAGRDVKNCPNTNNIKNATPRASMASVQLETYNGEIVDRMMLDSGTTSNATSQMSKVAEIDDSSVRAVLTETRSFSLVAENWQRAVHLSNTLVVPNVLTNSLSVPALVGKNAADLHVPGKAVMELYSTWNMIVWFWDTLRRTKTAYSTWKIIRRECLPFLVVDLVMKW